MKSSPLVPLGAAAWLIFAVPAVSQHGRGSGGAEPQREQPYLIEGITPEHLRDIEARDALARSERVNAASQKSYES